MTIWAPKALKGKEMLVVTTAGAAAGLYTHEGSVGLTIQEVLAPMPASANYARMTYLEPLAFSGLPERMRTGSADIKNSWPADLANGSNQGHKVTRIGGLT